MKALRLFISITVALFIGQAISLASGIPAVYVTGGLMVSSFIPKVPAGSLAMALDVELWKDWIVETLFKNNEFLNYARNADEYVLQGSVVHIPNAGPASDVKRNRKSLPATVKKRTDTDISYVLDEFTSDPRLLTDAETILSYDKMDSMMGMDMRAIKQLVAEWMLYHWRAQRGTKWDGIIRTSGDVVTAHLSGATGNRKEFKLENLEEAQARFDEANMPDEDRFAMFSARMYKQMVGQLSAGDYKDFSRYYDAAKGVVGELFGFKIMKRSSVLTFNNAGTPAAKEPDASSATTDNDAVKCWQRDWVERAIGTTKIFENQQDATYFGDVYSLLVRGGGRKIEENGKGVIDIVQASA